MISTRDSVIASSPSVLMVDVHVSAFILSHIAASADMGCTIWGADHIL
jgi:hypothetical protein